MFANISIVQLGICLLIVILIFGTRRIRDAGHDLGGMIKGFKKEVKGQDALDVIKDVNSVRKTAKKARKIFNEG